MNKSKKVEHLVVDTSAFINKTPLQDVGTNIYSIDEVVNEIKNKRQLRSLIVLPYDLKIKDVFAENVKYITEFSKKTGDYRSLSATDIKVMALTYQLEKEKVGTEHLNENPKTDLSVYFAKPKTDEIPSNLAGFYVPSSGADCAESDMTDSSESKTDDVASTDDLQQELSAKFASLDCSNMEEDDEELDQMEDILIPVANSGNIASPVDEFGDDGFHEDEDSEDDEEGWITMENIAHVKKQMHGDESDEETEDVVVACVTSDFAMQNVLKQLGLHVVSTDGREIRQLRTYILRCYACFKTTSVMTKIFCPNCGNKTLKRVGVSLNKDGSQQIHLNARRPISTRGKKFSVPTPQGGKHANNPILCEDQRLPLQQASRLARMKNNPMDPDYIAGYSPFLMKDVNSRSVMLGAHGGPTKNWMKKNPNAPKRKTKK